MGTSLCFCGNSCLVIDLNVELVCTVKMISVKQCESKQIYCSIACFDSENPMTDEMGGKTRLLRGRGRVQRGHVDSLCTEPYFSLVFASHCLQLCSELPTLRIGRVSPLR